MNNVKTFKILNEIIPETGVVDIIMGYKQDIEEKEYRFFNRNQVKKYYENGGEEELLSLNDTVMIIEVIKYVNITPKCLMNISNKLSGMKKVGFNMKLLENIYKDNIELIKSDKKTLNKVIKDLFIVFNVSENEVYKIRLKKYIQDLCFRYYYFGISSTWRPERMKYFYEMTKTFNIFHSINNIDEELFKYKNYKEFCIKMIETQFYFNHMIER